MLQNETEAHLEKVFREYAGAVRKFALRRGASTQDAEEIVIDTFVIYWRHLPEKPARARPWLLGIARRLLKDRRRAHTRFQALLRKLAEEGSIPRGEAQSMESSLARRDALLLAIAKLPGKDQELLFLVAWESLSAEETGRVLDLPPGAVRHRLGRIRGFLRQELGQYYA
jgi:RNA polymerase sigma factor (sigma-70 family)